MRAGYYTWISLRCDGHRVSRRCCTPLRHFPLTYRLSISGPSVPFEAWCFYAFFDLVFLVYSNLTSEELIFQRMPRTLKLNVDLLRIIQLGLTFADEQARTALYPPLDFQQGTIRSLHEPVYAHPLPVSGSSERRRTTANWKHDGWALGGWGGGVRDSQQGNLADPCCWQFHFKFNLTEDTFAQARRATRAFRAIAAPAGRAATVSGRG
jgi:hypothetical protein